jgi:CcmD family protein
MRVMRSLFLATVVSLVCLPGALAAHSQPPPAQEEFVPLSEIPPEEQIPAFTLVATAYGLVWVVLIGYVWSVSRRLQTVEAELASLGTKNLRR